MPAGLRAPALLSGLALVLTVTACGEVGSEPEVDYEAFAESVAELPAVESVDTDGDGDGDGEAFTAEISAEADEAALRTTGRRIMRLLGVAGVGYDASPLTIVSGPYTLEGAYGYSDPDTGTYRSDRLDLTDLPHLHALPDVASGILRNGTATVTLAEGADLRTWVEDAVTRDGHTRVHAYPAEEDSQETEGPDDTPGADGGTDAQTAAGSAAGSSAVDRRWVPADSDDLEESFRFHLGSEANTEAVQKLFTAADAADATVVTAEVYTEGDVDADLELQSLDALEQLDDVFTDEYDALTGFTFHTGDGLRLDYGSSVESHYSPSAPSIDDVLSAHEQIEDLGASLTSVSAGLREAEVEAPDTGVLRDVADAVSSSSWPLEPTERVSLHHPDSPDADSSLAAEWWGERVDVLASLWDAGFIDATERGESATDVTIHRGQGPDFTTAAGRDALIAALRGADWQANARITLEDSQHLTFESTADGKALNPHNPQGDASAELSEWAQEFVDAWDATAG